jgi:hypothetical protein
VRFTPVVAVSLHITAGVALIDDQDGRMCVGLQRLRELPVPEGSGEIIDEGCGRREEGIKAVLDGAVRDGDRQVGLPAAGFVENTSDRPSVTKSGASAEPSMCIRNVD